MGQGQRSLRGLGQGHLLHFRHTYITPDPHLGLPRGQRSLRVKVKGHPGVKVKGHKGPRSGSSLALEGLCPVQYWGQGQLNGHVKVKVRGHRSPKGHVRSQRSKVDP